MCGEIGDAVMDFRLNRTLWSRHNLDIHHASTAVMQWQLGLAVCFCRLHHLHIQTCRAISASRCRRFRAITGEVLVFLQKLCSSSSLPLRVADVPWRHLLMQYYGIEDILRTFESWLYGSPHAVVVASQALCCWCFGSPKVVREPVASRLFGICFHDPTGS